MLLQIKLEFWRICTFPNVVGTIYFTHIKIPGNENAELFRNQKGSFLVNVQAVLGPNLEIQNIVARWPGSVHDAQIFNNSRLYAQFKHGDIQGMLLGDNGYPCQTAPELRYNASQIRTRNTVERMFGFWKRLFPCLSMSIRTKLSTTLTIIMATAVLYNFVRGRNEIEDEDPNENPLPVMNDQGLALGNTTHRALIIQHFT